MFLLVSNLISVALCGLESAYSCPSVALQSLLRHATQRATSTPLPGELSSARQERHVFSCLLLGEACRQQGCAIGHSCMQLFWLRLELFVFAQPLLGKCCTPTCRRIRW